MRLRVTSTTSIRVGFQHPNRRRLLTASGLAGGFRKRSSLSLSASSLSNNSCMSCGISFCGLRPADSISMGTELVRTAFSSPIRLKLCPPMEMLKKLLLSILTENLLELSCRSSVLHVWELFVWVVNGALEYLAKDLGIAENTVLQGKMNTTAQSVQTMIIGRLLAGIGIGISSAIVPLYISEISPTEIRGALGSVNQLFICIGILLALVAGLPLAGNPLWWRTMFGICCPRYSIGSGNGIFTRKSSMAFSVVSVGVALFFFQQMAGINAVVYYSTAVFRSVGIASDVAASALVGASNVFGTTVASSLMDRQGRKSLLITSFLGMAASMLLLSLSFTWKVLAPYSGTLAVLGTVCYVLSFSLGAGPVPALLLPEIFASRIRAKAVALSLGMHWISNFFIGLYFLSVVNKFGISTVYLGFAAICVLAVLYIAGNVVETKGRSLEEIERALNPAI
ncbi:hypothetical protein GH714_013433 [Hevea brasiliensis]|uniref:Major facilitator superfamily (MFS) profile domain-containing protein n=1 Tax=Hevea brasiliensis TaxID=3981 RepID=A0A6A6MJ62_HEVBR|nr:hypothetical protein GH714_013433 [Hevea brasiliensis]